MQKKIKNVNLKMKETELAQHIIDYYQDWEVFKEVPCAGIIDIVCRKGCLVVSIECKVQLSFDVIEQAYKNLSFAHFSYIAVPFTKGKTFAYKICQQLGIGILMYNPHCSSTDPLVREYVKPKLNRNVRLPKLQEYMKESVAGSQNQRVTAFQNTVREITDLISRHKGKIPIKEIFKDAKYHYSSNTSAIHCIKNMSIGEHRIIKEFYYEDGFLILNKQK